MENEDNVPIKKRNKGLVKTLLWIAGIGILFSIILSPSNNRSSTAPVEAPTNTASSQVQNGPASSFGDGTFVIGTDIQSGTYRNSGGENCYYARLSGFGGTNNDITANDNTNSSAIVTIQSTDKGFTSQRCGTWTKISTPPKASATSKTTAHAPSTSSSQPNQQTSSVATPPAPAATWHTVTTLSGQTQKNSPPFTIKGSQWRISWQETGDGYFGATAESPDNSGSYCAIANLVGNGSDSTYCYDPGTYYVSVNTANSWTITVEDYY